MSEEKIGTALVKAPSAPLTTVEPWEWETPLGPVSLSLELVRKYFCKMATETEAMHFLSVCRYHRLNPYLREAYIIKYQESEAAQIVVGKWAHARKAEEHLEYSGDEGGIIIKGKDGSIERRAGTFWIEPETVVGGWAKVYRKDRQFPILREVRLADWMRPGPYWKTSPAHMIAKVAMSQARHEAFPGDYSGTISEDEANAGPRQIQGGVGEIPLPKSLKEMAAVEPVDAECNDVPPTVTPYPTADEQEEIRRREQLESAAQAEPVSQHDRRKIWDALLRRAKSESVQTGKLLCQLVGHQVAGLAACTEEDIGALEKALLNQEAKS